MKYLVYLFSAINLYAGIRFLLNAVGILQTSKYGNSSNIFFAITLTTAALFALYFSVLRGNHSSALLIDAAPWILTLVLVVGNMLFGDYK
jgi:hypothetical protein